MGLEAPVPRQMEGRGQTRKGPRAQIGLRLLSFLEYPSYTIKLLLVIINAKCSLPGHCPSLHAG